ncbi:putative MATE family efflux protein [Halanaerobium congolense]|uniref:Probable multidrug resistance protein NorM n=1 Tax=Halanaerobium congolense TaxID=54121 RepID=A0A4R8GFH5_9FIRM|nr:MATE family efflux transporter [Halanaerobium congolense]TDX44380.1 putative MATE family efflux protein [Halanaerobium congolense]
MSVDDNEALDFEEEEIINSPQLGNREHIINGPIVRTLFKLASPVMIGNTMQVVYNLADTFWLGKLGADSVAALSVGFPLVFLMISIGGGITVAGTTLVAQYMGSDNQKMANKITGQIFVFVMALSLVLATIGVLFNKNILHLMGAPAGILPDASSYLTIIFAGLPFMFSFFIFSALLRGYGDTKTPMKMVVFSAILNIILDPLLIFGVGFIPNLGVRGAAIATVFSRAVAGVIGIYILFTGKKGLVLSLDSLKPDFKEIKKILILGLPSAGEQSIVALGMTLLMSIVSQFGTIAVAAYGIGSRILSVVMLPTRGFATATTTMVGQNLGAEQSDRAEKSAWVSTGIILFLLTLLAFLFNLFPKAVISIFNSNPEVIKIGTSFLRIVGFSFGFLGIRFILGGSFRGAGNTVIAMLLAIIALWGIRLPLAHYLSINLGWGTNGIWWGMFFSNFITSIIAVIWFKKGGWKEKAIEE